MLKIIFAMLIFSLKIAFIVTLIFRNCSVYVAVVLELDGLVKFGEKNKL